MNVTLPDIYRSFPPTFNVGTAVELLLMAGCTRTRLEDLRDARLLLEWEIGEEARAVLVAERQREAA